MSSERQIAANRRNAQRSTGPRSAAGKATVAQNALKHGVLSRHILIPGENESHLSEFGKRMRQRLAPEGELELLLVDRIISSAWRLRRVLQAEAALMRKEAEGAFDRQSDLAAAFRGYAGKYVERISRYEATVERGLYKALGELQRLQKDREGRGASPEDV